jgi:hypothetical protein
MNAAIVQSVVWKPRPLRILPHPQLSIRQYSWRGLARTCGTDPGARSRYEIPSAWILK